jgi:hypothetical protein
MAANDVGRLHVCQGIVNAEKYRDEILGPETMPSARQLFLPDDAPLDVEPDFIYQQDSAPCHNTKIIQNWFTQNYITTLLWPGNSSDLNPIENLWHRLKCLVAKRKPSNKRELIETIIHSWNHVITTTELERLVSSMTNRCKAAILAQGYPTKY